VPAHPGAQPRIDMVPLKRERLNSLDVAIVASPPDPPPPHGQAIKNREGFWWRLACSPQITLYGHRKLHLSYRTRNFDYRTLADLGKTQELRDVVTTFATTVRIIIVTRRSTQVAATGRRRKSSRKQQKLLLL